MSKSLGNTLSVSEFKNNIMSKTLTFFDISFSDKKLDDSSKMIDKIDRFINNFDLDTIDIDGVEYGSFHLSFLDALNDDLNTPEALGIFFDFINNFL